MKCLGSGFIILLFSKKPQRNECYWMGMCSRMDTSTASHFNLQSFLLFEERSDLHADRFERIPRALPVHPHNAIICPMLGHIFCIRSSPVVSPIWITRVASVVPPSSSIFFWTLLRRISRYPVWDANNWKEKEHIRYCTTYPCSFQFGHH